MQTIPTTLLTQISRDTADYKAFIKVPLILIMALSGTMAAHVVSLFKCATEIMHADGQISPIGLTLFLLGVSAASFEIVLTNLAMKYYKQIEVIPIFQCFYFVMNITFGMLLLGEAKFYTTGDLFRIFGTSGISFVGIWIIYLKWKKTDELIH